MIQVTPITSTTPIQRSPLDEAVFLFLESEKVAFTCGDYDYTDQLNELIMANDFTIQDVRARAEQQNRMVELVPAGFSLN